MRTALFYNCLDSTQREYARLCETGGRSDRWVIRAEEQTAGVGRNENNWISPRGGLYLSFDLLYPRTVPSFALYVGHCLHKLLNDLYPLQELRIKWPNDIYLGGAKLAGIFCQHKIADSRYIIGIGINTNASIVNATLDSDIAILFNDIGFKVSNIALASLLVKAVEESSALLDNPEEYMSYCNAFLYGKGELAELAGAGLICTGRIQRITSDGALLLKDSEGQEHEIVQGSLRLLTQPG